MPRKPKPLLPVDDDLRTALIQSDQRLLPRNPALLKLIVHALLYRIRQGDAKEEKFLRLFVRGISMAEALAMRDEVHRKLLTRYLALDVYGLLHDKPRADHHVPTLRIQQTLLIEYFESNGFRSNATEQINTWLQRRVHEIWELIKPFPCLCNYRDSLNDMNLEKPTPTETFAELIRLILAELHVSTPENIRKLLKRPYKKLKVDVEAVKEFLRQAK